jgi:hypothetical protein
LPLTRSGIVADIFLPGERLETTFPDIVCKFFYLACNLKFRTAGLAKVAIFSAEMVDTMDPRPKLSARKDTVMK